MDNPEVRTQATVTLDTEKTEMVKKQVETAIAQRSTWEQKLEVFYKRRHGIRPAKTFPWPGCSNINIPLIDKTIRRQKPVYVNAIFGVNPILAFEPVGGADPERAKRLEQAYDWLVRYRMERTEEEINHLVDCQCETGLAFIKVLWDYEEERFTRSIDAKALFKAGSEIRLEDEQQIARHLGLDLDYEEDRTALASAMKQIESGDEIIQVKVRSTTRNAPCWKFVHPRDLIVPWDATDDIDALPWIAHRLQLTPNEIRARGRSGLYDSSMVEAAIEGGSNSRANYHTFGTNIEQTQDQREGILDQQAEGSFIELWEVYFHHDLDGDGIEERCVMVLEPKSCTVLRVKEFGFEHGMWPFVRFAYEQNEPRWYSPRGIPELLYDLNAELNVQHNAKVDRMTIQNALTFKVRGAANLNPADLVWRPGNFINVKRMDDIEPIQHQVLDWSYENEERSLKGWAEEYVGVTDFGISNVNQRVERRTAREVEEISQASDMVATLDLRNFQRSARRLHKMTLSLWAQYGDPTVYIRVGGGDTLLTFNRWEFYEDYDLVPVGRLDNLNNRSRAQRALQDMQIAANPAFSPYVNGYELVRDYFENSDFRASRRFLRAPGLMEQDATQQQINEILLSREMGLVVHVDAGDPHEIHAQVCQGWLQTNQEKDPDTALLVVGHLALHMAAMGDTKPLQEFIQQTGFQPQQVGNRTMLVPPQQQEQQAQGA